VVAILLTTALLSGGGGPARAASSTCIWTKHTKRVVDHVKRRGKFKRVVRIKHYRTCRKVAVPEPTPTTTAPPPAPAPAPPSEPAPTPTPEPEPNALGVSAYDQGGFRYELSRQTVRSGQLTLQLNNRGEDPHSMDMQKIGPNEELEGEIIKMPAIKAGSETEPKSVYVEPGSYRMWCTIGNHAEEGMKADITVE
jgi:plastocyanin